MIFRFFNALPPVRVAVINICKKAGRISVWLFSFLLHPLYIFVSNHLYKKDLVLQGGESMSVALSKDHPLLQSFQSAAAVAPRLLDFVRLPLPANRQVEAASCDSIFRTSTDK